MTTDLPPGLTARPFTPADLDAAYAVYSAAEVEDSGHLALEPEDIAGDWARPSFDLATDSVGVFDGGRLVGAAEVTRGGARAEGAVLPGERGRGIGSWLAAWTEERATSLGSSRVGQVTPEGSLPQRLLLGRGYTLGHTSWVLELPEGREIANRPLPEGYALGTGDTAERERAAYVVIQDAFDEWEGRVRESFEDWAATTVRRPALGAVAAARRRARRSGGGRLVHHPRQPGRGLRVPAGRRALAPRAGLAQALLADAFRGAAEHGASHSELSTDSRTGALDLYLKVGMEVTQTWTNLVADLPRGG